MQDDNDLVWVFPHGYVRDPIYGPPLPVGVQRFWVPAYVQAEPADQEPAPVGPPPNVYGDDDFVVPPSSPNEGQKRKRQSDSESTESEPSPKKKKNDGSDGSDGEVEYDPDLSPHSRPEYSPGKFGLIMEKNGQRNGHFFSIFSISS